MPGPADRSRSRAALRRRHRLLGGAGVGGVLAQSVLTLLTGGWASLKESLPPVDGVLPVATLSAPAMIERDAQGLVTITATSEFDAYRALGVVHAHDRLFQMDGNRRSAAGRLAEWLGPTVLQEDIGARSLFLQEAAERAFREISERERAALVAYAEGVNAGIASLPERPPEYAILGVEPEPWEPTDSLLIALNMCRYLSYGGSWRERNLAAMRVAYPAEVVRFFTQPFSRFDTVNEIADFGSWAFEPAVPPGEDVIDLRRPRTGDAGGRALPESDLAHASDAAAGWRGGFFGLPPAHPVPDYIGSNNWALGGGRTEHGGGILANDMHLELMVPNTWYRADIRWGETRLVGLTLPGLPGLVVGSNTFVAWGFTNVHGDFVDHILIEVNPDDPNQYRVPGPSVAWEDFGSVSAEIIVRGGEAHEQVYRTTRWGPVTREIGGQPAVAKWTCTEPGGLNLSLVEMPDARDAAEAAGILARWHGPPQNVAMADRDGGIAMVVSGYIPRRLGFDGSVPTSWADGTRRWDGPIPMEDRFGILGGGNGRMISANSRITSDLRATRIIGEPFTLGIRQFEIERALREHEKASEADMLAVQLDTRSSFHDFYRDLLLAHIPEETDDAELKEIREAAMAWDGHAKPGSRGLAFLSAFSQQMRERLLSEIRRHFVSLEPGSVFTPVLNWPLMEESMRRLYETQPRNFLPSDFETWTAFFQHSAREARNNLRARGLPASAPWSVAQTTRVQHPLMMALDGLGLPDMVKRRLSDQLNMPDVPGRGYWTTIRVQTRSFGASQRLVVAPGREEHGILHMPAGQSGHFMSPWYRAGHADWEQGTASPLLAGETVHRLELVPDAGR